MTSLYLTSIFLLLFLAVSTAFGQNNTGCTCDPVCKGLPGGGKCENSKMIPRSDCPCCMVCSQLQDWECSDPVMPCDQDYGLICSTSSGKCEAEYHCENDHNCPDDRLCLGKSCIRPCAVFRPCDGILRDGVCVARGHKANCECPEGRIKNVFETNCVIGDGSEPDSVLDNSTKPVNSTPESTTTIAEIATMPLELEQTEEKTPIGHTIVTLDTTATKFALELPSSDGGVLFFKPQDDEQWQNKVDIRKGHFRIGTKDLIPTTSYNITFVDASNHSYSSIFTTKAGCTESRSGEVIGYDLRETWYRDCDEVCTCREDQASHCQPRCLMRPGHNKDSTCKEVPLEEDPECCVTYQCETTEVTEVNKTKTEADSKLMRNKLPSLLIMKKTFNSITIFWDDFMPRNFKGGYYIEYRENSRAESNEWIRIKALVNNYYSVTIKDLKPKTEYQIRVSIDLQSDNPLEYHTTETVTARTEPACVYKGTQYGVGDFYVACSLKCICSPDGKTECSPRCKSPYVMKDSVSQEQSALCQQSKIADDCCVFLDCKNTSDLENDLDSKTNSLKVIVMNQTYDSITVAWDDFRSQTSQGGLAVEYKQFGASSENVWMTNEDKKSKNITYPPLILTSLKPGTNYYVRVLINDENNNKQSVSEEVVTYTKPGCISHNATYPVGIFYNGCDEQCECFQNGQTKCSNRCTPPYYRKGTDFESDSRCIEVDSIDECCTRVNCSPNQFEKGSDDFNQEQLQDKECAKNAMRNNDFICKCFEGYSGDPYNLEEGCTKNLSKCLSKGKIHYPGQKVLQGCDYECICTDDGALNCGPRCKFPKNNPLSIDEGCEYIPHPDDECCLQLLCNSTVDESSVSIPDSSFDGCIEDNKVYKPHENFTRGCKSRCTCLGQGDIDCAPRCPPSKIVTNDDRLTCETLPDPLDSCCSVTVCDKKVEDEALDVMRDNVNDNQKEGDRLKEALKEVQNSTLMLKEGLFGIDTEDQIANETLKVEEDPTINNTTKEQQVQIDQEYDVLENKTTLFQDNIIILKNDSLLDIMMKIRKLTKEELLNNINMTDANFTEIFRNDKMKFENLTEEEKNHHIVKIHNRLSITEENMKDLIKRTTKDKLDNVVKNVQALMLLQIKVQEEMLAKNLTELIHDNKNLTAFEIKILDHKINLLLDNATKFEKNIFQMFTRNINTDKEIEDVVHREFKNHESEHSEVKGRSELSFGEIEEINEINIISADPIDPSTIKITLQVSPRIHSDLIIGDVSNIEVNYSKDSLTWFTENVSTKQIQYDQPDKIILKVGKLESETSYEVKVKILNTESVESATVILPGQDAFERKASSFPKFCIHNNNTYKEGEEFYNDCLEFCQCSGNGDVHCEKINCPTMSGLDIVDHNCREWEKDPSFIPNPPKCCSPMQCKIRHTDDCEYKGQFFRHFDDIPEELTGCDKKCSCSYGNVTCTNMCDPVPQVPPSNLPCPPSSAMLTYPPGETCCKIYICPSGGGFIPNIGPNGSPLPRPPANEISDLYSVRVYSDMAVLNFSIPSSYVRFPGSLYVRYRNTMKEDVWNNKSIEHDSSILNKKHWFYILEDLKPDSVYEVIVVLKVLNTEIKSNVLQVHTNVLSEQNNLKPMDPLNFDAELSAKDISETSASITWKSFNEKELEYIDGVQVRYMAENQQMPQFSRILHRNNHQAKLRDLIPGTIYSVNLMFPSEDDLPKVTNIKPIEFTTLTLEDPYNFNITISSKKVTTQTAEIIYGGIPMPAKKYVNVFKAVYLRQGKDNKQRNYESHNFKQPKSGESFIFLNDLKPDVEYQVWIEAYLSNGKKKESNVITIKTKLDSLPKPEKSEVDPSTQRSAEDDDYYSAFVTAAIIAAFAVLAIVSLLALLVRRQNHAKAHINPPKSNAAYDNPSYSKTFDVEMNGMKESSTPQNGATHMDDP